MLVALSVNVAVAVAVFGLLADRPGDGHLAAESSGPPAALSLAARTPGSQLGAGSGRESLRVTSRATLPVFLTMKRKSGSAKPSRRKGPVRRVGVNEGAERYRR